MRKNLPNVPRPPILILPNLANGTEKVTMFGVMLRMTITSSGLEGTSCEDIETFLAGTVVVMVLDFGELTSDDEMVGRKY